MHDHDSMGCVQMLDSTFSMFRCALLKQTTAHLVAGMILAHFSRGIELTGHFWETIRRTLQIDSLSELERRVSGDPDSEAICVFNMLLFPDRSLQLRLEPILQRKRFGGEDVDSIAGILIDRQAGLRLISGNMHLILPIHPSLIPVFLERLHLTWVMDRSLLRLLHHRLGSVLWIEGAVRFRNGEFPATGLQERLTIQFLCEASGSAEKIGWLERIDFLMDILAENPMFRDVWELIEDSRRFWLQMYEKALQSERLLSQHNMETLMMARTPIGALTQEEILKRIELHETVLGLRPAE